MGWEKEYEHWRDYGHTWGPGIDDRREPTEEEIEANNAWWREYEAKKDRIRVAPREEYVLAKKKLDEMSPSSEDIIRGKAPYGYERKCSEQFINYCRQAVESMGYELVKGYPYGTRDRDKFSVSVECSGFEPGDHGRIIKYSVNNIPTKEDCLQLFADFTALGDWPTVYHKDYIINLPDSAELRLEMERWGYPIDEPSPAKEVPIADRNENKDDKEQNKPEREERYILMTEDALFSEYEHFLDDERMKDIDGHGYVLDCHQRTPDCLIDVLKRQDIEVIRHHKDFYVNDPYDVFLQAEGKVISFSDLPLEVRIKAAEKEVVRNDLAVKGERGQAR